MTCKIIVLGDINGELQPVFHKLSVLHEKNNFSFALITGNLFSQDESGVADLIAGNISIPITTYFTVADIPLPQQIIDKINQSEEISPNLHFLGKRSITKTSEGVKIATLGGKPDETIGHVLSREQYLPFHSIADAKVLHGANTADILLTTSWPATVRNGSKIQIADDFISPAGHEHISTLCANLTPRYHFSRTKDFFFEREPFYNDKTPSEPNYKRVTRFISLSAHGTPKQKSLYAFSLPPIPVSHVPLALGTTVSPWVIERKMHKRKALDSDPALTNEKHSWKLKKMPHSSGRRLQKRPPTRPDECFFCLSNPQIATHLITSIGEDSYLTNAKGPLTTALSNSQLNIDFPAHILIIPLTHSPTLGLIHEEDNTRKKTAEEMTRFKKALQDMIAKKSGNKLGAVTYEISKSNGIHTHWQFVPVPEEIIRKGLVEAAFAVEAEKLSYPAFEIKDPLSDFSDENFFRAWIWAPPCEKNLQGYTNCISLSFDQDFKFSAQYGRIVLAKLLGLEKRAQWKNCIQLEEDEKKDAEAFKMAFKDYDFSL